MRIRLLLAGLLALFIVSCSDATVPTQTTLPAATRPAHTASLPPSIPQTPTPMPVVAETLSCGDWQARSILPPVRESAKALYERGQQDGNNPRAFSKIGDGEIAAAWFLTAYDLGPEHYDLGPHQHLVPLIEHFAGSFERIGIAARRGFNTQQILDTTSDLPALCKAGESPLTCELRLHKPAFAILSLGTNQVWEPEEFEAGMRRILETLLAHNIVPILSTKGDNLEGDHRINHTIACLAQDYDLPLWNFWAAIQPLPNHGLQPDLEHLTYGIPDFSDAMAMQSAWTVRNLTALQTLDAVWRGVAIQQ